MPVVSPFRVSPEDLPDLPKDVRNGLQPLLDALNVTVQQLVEASQAKSSATFVMSLKTGASVADSFPLRFRNPLSYAPSFIGLNVRPKDPAHTTADPFVLGPWSLSEQNLVVVSDITNLLPDQTYQLTFQIE